VEAPWFTTGPNGSFRLWPHKLLGEGHFAAVLRRAGDWDGRRDAPAGERLPDQWEPFRKALDISLPEGKCVRFGQSVYWAPAQMPDIRGVRVLRPGLALGEEKKGRFEPDHALALWLKTAGKTVDLEADSPLLRDYMHGQTIPCTLSGWCLVQVDGYSLGWGKGDGTVLKNHYPKGLRR
jgi:NOL1/NOP2/fmu family ribosome biogenesis protein